jgi:hypothetical protein
MTSMHTKVASAENGRSPRYRGARSQRGLTIIRRSVLLKPQLHAGSERIAQITLIVNTTGYSRRKDDASCVRDAGANVLELGRRIGLCAESIVGARRRSFV